MSHTTLAYRENDVHIYLMYQGNPLLSFEESLIFYTSSVIYFHTAFEYRSLFIIALAARVRWYSLLSSRNGWTRSDGEKCVASYNGDAIRQTDGRTCYFYNL